MVLSVCLTSIVFQLSSLVTFKNIGPIFYLKLKILQFDPFTFKANPEKML